MPETPEESKLQSQPPAEFPAPTDPPAPESAQPRNTSASPGAENDVPSGKEDPSGKSDSTALPQPSRLYARLVEVLLAAAMLMLLAASGFRLGKIAHGASPADNRQPGLLASMAHFRGNLERMVAMRPGTDDRLGMATESFPDTLDTYWRVLNVISAHFYNPTPLSLFTATGRQIMTQPDRFRTHVSYAAIQGALSTLPD